MKISRYFVVKNSRHATYYFPWEPYLKKDQLWWLLLHATYLRQRNFIAIENNHGVRFSKFSLPVLLFGLISCTEHFSPAPLSFFITTFNSFFKIVTFTMVEKILQYAQSLQTTNFLLSQFCKRKLSSQKIRSVVEISKCMYRIIMNDNRWHWWL